MKKVKEKEMILESTYQRELQERLARVLKAQERLEARKNEILRELTELEKEVHRNTGNHPFSPIVIEPYVPDPQIQWEWSHTWISDNTDVYFPVDPPMAPDIWRTYQADWTYHGTYTHM